MDATNLDKLLIWIAGVVMIWLTGLGHIIVVLVTGVGLPESLAAATLTAHSFGAAAFPVLLLTFICVQRQKKYLFVSIGMLFVSTVANAVTFGLSDGELHARAVNASGGVVDTIFTVNNVIGAGMLLVVFLVNVARNWAAWREDVEKS